VHIFLLDRENNQLIIKMSESSKIITRHLVIDKDLLILGDMKMSLNILKIRENKDKPGELTLA